MSSGEETYNALHKGVLEAIVEGFKPDWDTLAKGAYLGFIKDVSADARVTWGDYPCDPTTCEPMPDAELSLQAYISDADCEDIGRQTPLSELLLDMTNDHDIETVMHLLNNSLAAFSKKLEEGAQ